MKRLGVALAVGVTLLPATASANEDFSFMPPGDLTPGSGSGRDDATVYAPGMRFPIENGPAYPNSQVYGHGGGSGPGGGQCDTANYSYPWRDNYCESRSWDMPLCPSGTGHQGQDIRPGTCEDRAHWIVASESGTVTNVGSYSIYVTTASGQRFDYLHGNDVSVSSGQAVEKGQRLATVSNAFGGTPTTIHLHFNIRQDVAGVGFVFVSPYMSLVESYEDLLGLGSEPPAGPVEAVTCEAISGWAQDPDAPDEAVEVRVYFGGDQNDPEAVGVTIPADEYRDDLCTELGSCEHGFTLEVPRSLYTGQPHPVYVYGVDNDGSETTLLGTGPREVQCSAPAAPVGVRRRVDGPEAMADWEMSPFWDAIPADAGELEDIQEGADWPERRVVVRGDDGSADWWLVDLGRRRLVTPGVAEIWDIDESEVQVEDAAAIDDLPLGPPLRADKFVLSADGVTLYVIDEDVCDAEEDCDGGSNTSGTTDGGSGDDTDGDAGGGGIGGTDGPQALPDYEERDQGCGCRTVKPAKKASLFGLLLLLGLIRRRR